MSVNLIDKRDFSVAVLFRSSGINAQQREHLLWIVGGALAGELLAHIGRGHRGRPGHDTSSRHNGNQHKQGQQTDASVRSLPLGQRFQHVGQSIQIMHQQSQTVENHRIELSAGMGKPGVVKIAHDGVFAQCVEIAHLPGRT